MLLQIAAKGTNIIFLKLFFSRISLLKTRNLVFGFFVAFLWCVFIPSRTTFWSNHCLFRYLLRFLPFSLHSAKRKLFRSMQKKKRMKIVGNVVDFRRHFSTKKWLLNWRKRREEEKEENNNEQESSAKYSQAMLCGNMRACGITRSVLACTCMCDLISQDLDMQM